MGRPVAGVPPRFRPRVVGGGALLLAIAILAAGCTTDNDEDLDPIPDPETSETATPAPTETGPPVLVPDGSAKQNLDYFDSVNLELEEDTEGMPLGRDIVDNLVAAGFEKSRMEITPDRTAIDLAADTIEFTVRIDDNCLFGQFGDFDYRSVVLPVLDTGKCLVGKTRTISW